MALALHQPALAVFLFGWSWATRVALAALVGGAVVREPHPWRKAMLYPIRDLLGFFFWSASYLEAGGFGGFEGADEITTIHPAVACERHFLW